MWPTQATKHVSPSLLSSSFQSHLHPPHPDLRFHLFSEPFFIKKKKKIAQTPGRKKNYCVGYDTGKSLIHWCQVSLQLCSKNEKINEYVMLTFPCHLLVLSRFSEHRAQLAAIFLKVSLASIASCERQWPSLLRVASLPLEKAVGK